MCPWASSDDGRVPAAHCLSPVGGFNRETAINALKSGHADLICFGRKYLSNPDLPKRFKKNTKLNPYNRDTFYTQDPVKVGCLPSC